MDHKNDCDHANCTHANASVSQTLSEMHWERGLWYAGNYFQMLSLFEHKNCY